MKSYVLLCIYFVNIFQKIDLIVILYFYAFFEVG